MTNPEHYKGILRKNVDSFINRATKGLGARPLVFLDAGAMIHFEKIINTVRKASSNRVGSLDFYGIWLDACPKTYVTTYVNDEIGRHCDCHFVNGNKEVSDETKSASVKMHKSLINFVREASHQKSYQDVRYDVFWASFLSFPQNHKKCNGDRISITDKDLIAACVDSRYTDGTTGASIITTDSHINRTVDVLTGKHSGAMDNYHTIMDPIQSRVKSDSNPAFPFLSSTPLFNYDGVKVINLLEGKI